jgi:2-polyprenyl-6-methoxyphenol hydroxylase-like FAD-dependent oxidoreductase
LAQPSSDILIVGAGPTGLAAALFLAAKNIPCRIIDKVLAPSATSRAQVVNPRSLELLTPSGVASDMLAEARPLDGVSFYEAWEPLAALNFEDTHPDYRLSVLPQARTEAMLAHALYGRGFEPERGVALESFTQDEDGVDAVLAHAGGRRETMRTPLMLGADGSHSVARHALGLTFDGSAFPETWPLYDLRLDDPLDLDRAHVSFVPRGLIFTIAIRPGLWRVLGDMDEPLDHLPPGTKRGEIEWSSNFHVAHRVASKQAVGRVMLAGDAAHIHSPIAARGMNLGIEDAFVFADCAADALRGDIGRIADYGHLRHGVHKRVVGRIEKLTALARGQPEAIGLLRRYLIPGITHVAPARRRMEAMVSGLDHPVRTR